MGGGAYIIPLAKIGRPSEAETLARRKPLVLPKLGSTSYGNQLLWWENLDCYRSWSYMAPSKIFAHSPPTSGNALLCLSFLSKLVHKHTTYLEYVWYELRLLKELNENENGNENFKIMSGMI